MSDRPSHIPRWRWWTFCTFLELARVTRWRWCDRVWSAALPGDWCGTIPVDAGPAK